MLANSGVIPAMVTPFDERDRVDEPGLVKLFAWFKAAGCAGVVLAGTNGEGPSLNSYEKRDLVKTAIDSGLGLPVILGVSTDSLTEAVWLAKQAKQSGAESALVMPPSYFTEASQEGLARWYERLIDESACPIMVYNLPKRTHIRFEVETIARLAENPGVAGFKDSSGEEPNLATYKQASRGKRLCVGDENLLIQALDAGWWGTISGAANVIPNWLVQVVAEYAECRECAETKFGVIADAIQSLRGAPQPYTNKHLLKKLGVVENDSMRLPLMTSSGPAIERAAAACLELMRATAA